MLSAVIETSKPSKDAILHEQLHLIAKQLAGQATLFNLNICNAYLNVNFFGTSQCIIFHLHLDWNGLTSFRISSYNLIHFSGYHKILLL